MEVTEQEKRQGLASELADILHRQSTLVACNPLIINYFEGDEVETIRNMAEEDEKNLRLIETVITNFGLRIEPKTFARRLSDLTSELIQGDTALWSEKLACYSLLKENQVMCSHIVHKASQLALPDIKEALLLFEGVQASFAKQHTQLSELVEKKSMQWLMGEEPERGLVGRTRDVLAGAVGSVMARAAEPAEDTSILNVLRLDHRKVQTLFQEIESSQQHQQAYDLFLQLRADLSAHAEAEEMTVYKPFQKYVDLRDRLDDSWAEHEDMRTLLDTIEGLQSQPQEFMNRVDELKQLVNQHVDEEENEMFKLFEQKVGEQELIRMAGDFTQVKKRIQQEESAGSAADPGLARDANFPGDPSAPTPV